MATVSGQPGADARKGRRSRIDVSENSAKQSSVWNAKACRMPLIRVHSARLGDDAPGPLHHGRCVDLDARFGSARVGRERNEVQRSHRCRQQSAFARRLDEREVDRIPVRLPGGKTPERVQRASWAFPGPG